MEFYFRDYRDKVAILYVHDLIFSHTFDEHLSHIKLVIDGLESHLA